MNARAPTSDDQYFDHPYGVRSLSLEEIVTQAQHRSLFTRIGDFIKTAILAWGLITLGAAIGVAVYYFNGASGTSILVSERPAPAASPAEPDDSAPVSPTDRVAVAFESAPSAAAVFAPAVLPDISELRPRPSELPAPESMPSTLASLQAEPSVADIRVPRPRPDEPVITGSIRPPRHDPDYAPAHRRRISGPCATLRKLGAPVRC